MRKRRRPRRKGLLGLQTTECVVGAWGRDPGSGSRSPSLNVVLWRGRGWGPEEDAGPALGPVARSCDTSGNLPEASKGQASPAPQPCLPMKGAQVPRVSRSVYGDNSVPKWGHCLPMAPRTFVSPKQPSKPPPSGPGGDVPLPVPFTLSWEERGQSHTSIILKHNAGQ